MNTAKAAAALNTASLALAELAEALLESPETATPVTAGAPARAASPAAPPDLPPSFDELPPEWAEDPIAPVLAATGGVEVGEGSLVSCPKHHVLYRDGRYGKYCPSTSDEPAWANSKGFCKITPKNAAEYLRIRAAA